MLRTLMVIANGIRSKGFRKWYERELIRSHSHLLLLVFCALAVVGGLEALFGGAGAQRLVVAAALLAAVGIGAWALRRYLFFLMRAEHIANQAVCATCQAYGHWQIEREAAQAQANGATGTRIDVCCRRCGHRWPIGW